MRKAMWQINSAVDPSNIKSEFYHFIDILWSELKIKYFFPARFDVFGIEIWSLGNIQIETNFAIFSPIRINIDTDMH